MSSSTVAPHRSATLALLSVAQFLIALDYSIVYVALPSIATELGLEPATAQWIVSAYAVPFAGFLVLGGRLADRIGPKRLFILAIIAFGLASAIGGVAENGAVLLAARGTQGLAAALLQPAILGLIGIIFPAGPSRSGALAVWGGVGASGLAAGVILGGLLTALSWRLTFMINVPLTLLAAVIAVRAIAPGIVRAAAPGTQPRRSSARIPALASALGTTAALTLALGLTVGPTPLGAAFVTIALLAFMAFAANERRSGNALIEPVLRGIRSLRSGAGATALYMASVGSEFYLLTLLLQTTKSYSPLQAGLAFLPLAVLVTAGNATAGRLLRKSRASIVLAVGFATAATGLLWLALVLDQDYTAMLPGILLSGLGHGIIYTAMFVIGTRDVPESHQATAGALLTTSQYLSGALVIAVLTLTLGPTPTIADFRPAFLLITAAALAGLTLALTRRAA